MQQAAKENDVDHSLLLSNATPQLQQQYSKSSFVNSMA